MLPILYQSPDFSLYSYPLFMGLGWGIAYQIYFALIPSEVSRRFTLLLYWGIFSFAWLGAKILFILTLPKDQAQILAINSSFWLGGGFVFYGGLLGGIIFLFLYRLCSFPFTTQFYTALLPAIAFGHAVGRIGCFLAGCCFGNPTNWWWGIHLHGVDRHPTQLLEAIGLSAIGYALLKRKTSPRCQLATYTISYGVLRFFLEFFRGDDIRGQWGYMTPSQWFSLFFILTGLYLLRLEFTARLADRMRL